MTDWAANRCTLRLQSHHLRSRCNSLLAQLSLDVSLRLAAISINNCTVRLFELVGEISVLENSRQGYNQPDPNLCSSNISVSPITVLKSTFDSVEFSYQINIKPATPQVTITYWSIHLTLFVVCSFSRNFYWYNFIFTMKTMCNASGHIEFHSNIPGCRVTLCCDVVMYPIALLFPGIVHIK